FAYSDNGAISRFGVARLTTVGQPDLTFSGDGELRTGFTGGAATAQAVVVQPNGRIVVAGQVESTTTQDFALVRYTVAGALDSSFGNGGRRTTSFGQSDAATGVAIQADGRIVAAGYASGSTADFALARYGPGGNLDGSFGNGGRVVTDISGEDTGSDVAISPLDGKILVAGTTYGGATVDIAIVRYLAA
ncbi:MAG TPA: delta-60 repeat domain-containing protein, partial [Actinomycetota bacterium]|nr:delta-60 repeat domain-containing protein [Actinomycetota bacterium]